MKYLKLFVNIYFLIVLIIVSLIAAMGLGVYDIDENETNSTNREQAVTLLDTNNTVSTTKQKTNNTKGETLSSSLPKHFTKTLDNGLEIVAIPMPNGTGVVSTDIFYKVGSRNEVMGKTGIAHMLEHLNFKSTKELPAGEFDTQVKSFGGLNNASTGFDQTHYYIRSSKPNVDKALSLFSELMQNLLLKDDEFQPERDVVAEERLWRTDNNPMGYLYFRMFNSAYVYHPYHWTPIGFMEDIKTWHIEDIRDFHKRYYQPKNAVVVIAGDIAKDEVFSLAEKHFAKVTNKANYVENIVDRLALESDLKEKKEFSIKEHFVEPEQDGARRIIIERDTQVEMMAIAFHIPDYLHPDQPTLSTISELLSAGKSSRLYKEIVDKKQLANQLYAYNMENIDPGLFICLAVCNPDVKAEVVEEEFLKQLELLKTTEVTQAELDKVKINTKAEFVFGFETASSVANLFGSYFTKGDIKPLLNLEANMAKVSSKDIQEVAKRYFKTSTSTTIILKPKKEGE
jgi:zinc protease